MVTSPCYPVQEVVTDYLIEESVFLRISPKDSGFGAPINSGS